MNIIINNENKETAAATLAELATELALPLKGVAVAIDNKIVPRTTWEATALTENANIVIIKAAFGG